MKIHTNVNAGLRWEALEAYPVFVERDVDWHTMENGWFSSMHDVSLDCFLIGAPQSLHDRHRGVLGEVDAWADAEDIGVSS